MATVLYIQRFSPSDVGHGGVHRAYQIQHDLQEFVGTENVLTYVPDLQFEFDNNLPAPSHIRVLQRLRVLYLALVTIGSPYKLLPILLANIVRSNPFGQLDLDGYMKFLQSSVRPDICVLEHPGFAPLIDINKQKNIPTILCPQNIESMDMYGIDLNQRISQYSFSSNFIQEFGFLASGDERLFISKIETGLIGGLGLNSHYYPYFPVGKINQRMRSIRQSRQDSVQMGLFLLVGSAGHVSTREGFRWFIRMALENGLPENVRVIVCGAQTEKLSSRSIPGLAIRGWIPQDELDVLMTKAQAVLIPQWKGFGMLTRLPEFICSGIPVLTSEHAMLSIDPLPGVYTLRKEWSEWAELMHELTFQHISLDESNYEEWERCQDRTLGRVLSERLL